MGLSLVPSGYEQIVEEQITTILYMSAIFLYAGIMFLVAVAIMALGAVGVYKLYTVVAPGETPAVSANSKEHGPLTPEEPPKQANLPKEKKRTGPKFSQYLSGLFFLSLLINDALVNRPEGSSLVAGSLARAGAIVIDIASTTVYPRIIYFCGTDIHYSRRFPLEVPRRR